MYYGHPRRKEVYFVAGCIAGKYVGDQLTGGAPDLTVGVCWEFSVLLSMYDDDKKGGLTWKRLCWFCSQRVQQDEGLTTVEKLENPEYIVKKLKLGCYFAWSAV